jgi:hypothetical protein
MGVEKGSKNLLFCCYVSVAEDGRVGSTYAEDRKWEP